MAIKKANQQKATGIGEEVGDAATMPLGIDPRELKTHVHARTFTWMSAAASFLTVSS